MNTSQNSFDIHAVINGLTEMHPEAKCALDHGSNFQLLVAVVLSAQTTDVSVNKVTPALFDRYPTAFELSEADQKDVQDIIRTIGLYKNKSANIIALSGRLVSEYDGEVPCSFEELVRLPGVGRKTANVVLAEGFGVPRIAVDTHVFRVAGRIGLSDGKDAAETEEQLMELIPRDQWILTHHLLIFHGRKVCQARNPKCDNCLINVHCLYHSQNNH